MNQLVQQAQTNMVRDKQKLQKRKKEKMKFEIIKKEDHMMELERLKRVKKE